MSRGAAGSEDFNRPELPSFCHQPPGSSQGYCRFSFLPGGFHGHPRCHPHHHHRRKLSGATRDTVALFVTNPGYQGFYGPLAGSRQPPEPPAFPCWWMRLTAGTCVTWAVVVEASAVGADLWVWGTHKLCGSESDSDGLLHLGWRKSPPAGLSRTSTDDRFYHLLASLDSTWRHLYLHGREFFARAAAYGEKIRNELANLPGVKVLTGEELPKGYHLDPLKVAFFPGAGGMAGYAAEKVLREEYRVQVEYADLHKLYLIISPAQKPREIRGLLKACRALAGTRGPGGDEKQRHRLFPAGNRFYLPGRLFPPSPPGSRCRRLQAGWPPGGWRPTRRGFLSGPQGKE